MTPVVQELVDVDYPIPSSPGGFSDLMNALLALENVVHEDLTVYRWRPHSLPELPALYNWMGSNPATDFTTAHIRDRFTILARIGIRHTDADEEMAKVELYTDAFRRVVDAALKDAEPLGGACTRAQRTGMRTVLDTFNESDVLAIELPIEVVLDRIV